MTACNTLSIIAPCFDEQGNIAELARRIDEVDRSLPDVKFELVLIDDGSRDDTWLEIQTARGQYANIVPVRHYGNAGIVAGWKSGLAAATGDCVLTIDADLQYKPEDIPTLLSAFIDNDVDLVQGARVVEQQRSAVRRLFTGGLSGLLNLLFGMHLKDNKSGFILYRREALTDVLQIADKFKYFQHFIGVAAHAAGYRIFETPIVFAPRYTGESFIQQPLRFAMRAALDMPRAIWEFRLAKLWRKS